MKIGIMTWYFAFNYGARAHSMALYQVLREMGHDVEFVNYPSNRSLRMAVGTCSQFENRKKHPLIFARCMWKMLKFYIQRSEYKTSGMVKTAEEIDNLGYDLIILGSDEVLNQKHKLYNDLYYGVGIKTPKMMYATSAGVVSPETKLNQQIQVSLHELKGIGVRDITTEKLIENNVGIQPQLVLDPTFLYSFPEKTRKHAEAYVLVYSFGLLNEYASQICAYAAQKGLKVYCVGRMCKWADRSFISSDLNEWLELYQHAELIVTDSYHGYIFALKNQKNYVLIKRSDKSNKIDGLIAYLEISKGYFDPQSDLKQYLKEPIDYSALEKNINCRKRESFQYLADSISKVGI